MKIIFLDFDGVLNSLDAIIHSGSSGGFTPIYKRHIDVLLFILKHTDAKIVVTSTWRVGRTIEQLQKLLPMIPIIGITESLDSRIRGEEIQSWLDNHKELNIEKFVILDDDDDMIHLKKNLVITDYNYGLTYVEAELCIEMLNGNNTSIFKNREFVEGSIIATDGDFGDLFNFTSRKD